MGLGEREASIDKGSAIACSICLEIVAGGGDRSTARLQCGHEFHLDCIGSAFNVKGVMQCPNCRKVEKGNWLYANGSRSQPELGFDEWTHDEDLYELSFSETTFGVHWCPFSRLARAPSSFEEGESSPAFAFQDLIGYHTMFTGNTATPLAADPGSYLAYLQPLQPPASSNSNSRISSESPIDHWSHTPGTPEVQTHGWEHHPAPYSLPSSRSRGSYQEGFSSTTVPAVRVDSDGLARAGSLFHPFILGHGSGSRLAGSFVSSLIPPYLTNSQPHGHVRDRYQHHNPPGLHGTIFSGTQQRSVSISTNGLPPAPVGPTPSAPVGPTPPSLPDQTTYYLFPPTTSSSRSYQDVENPGDHFYSTWERERLAPFPLLPVPIDRDSSWWRPFPLSSSMSDSSSRTGYWHRNGSERPSSQGRTEAASYRPPHVGRTGPYI